MSDKYINYCIIPAGGLGTRWKPVSNYIPKIMIPLVNRPTIDWILHEAIDSGCKEIIIVLDKGKSIIKRYILLNKDYQKNIKIHFIFKNKIRGVAEVVYLTKKIVGNNYFSMIISDHPCFYKTPPLKEMAQKLPFLKKYPDIVAFLAYARYPKYNNQYYGECLLKKVDSSLYKVLHLCPRPNRPNLNHHQGNHLRIAGRYIFNPAIFALTKECLQKNPYGDLSDWDIFRLAKKRGMQYFGMELKSNFLDMGTPETYGQASYFLLKKCIR